MAGGDRRHCATTATSSSSDVGGQLRRPAVAAHHGRRLAVQTAGRWRGCSSTAPMRKAIARRRVTETLISGLHPAGVTFPFLPNPDLKPETGKTWEFGVNYSRTASVQADDSLRLKAAYFNNDVDDYIGGETLSAFDPTSGCPFRPAYGQSGLHPDLLPVSELRQGEDPAASSWKASMTPAGISPGFRHRSSTATRFPMKACAEDLTTIPSSQVTGQLGFRFFEDNADGRRRGAVQRRAEGQSDRRGLYAGQCLRELSGDREFQGRFPRRQSVRRAIRQPAERHRPRRHSTSPASR